MTRRSFLSAAAASVASVATDLTSRRPRPADRRFTSPAVEKRIAEVKARIRNPELAWLFENCYPNTLDTTVEFTNAGGKPDTFIITGDIPAMWLRDSAAQTTPYLPLAPADPQLREMFRGVMHRQARCILLDPYANAFYREPKLGEWRNDETEMKPGVHERKWEVDSLCGPIRLAYLYWKRTGDASALDGEWRQAARLIVETFRVQQRLTSPGPYRFARRTTAFVDNSPNAGLGNPTRKIGLIHSAFRPSDDSCFFPFLVPSNMYAAVALRQLAALADDVLKDAQLSADCRALSATIDAAIQKHAILEHPGHGRIYAYEIDGFGNALWMDDANAPGLLSLAYLDCCPISDPVYQRTRRFVLSTGNPFFFHGTAGEGIGGPHIGPGMIWPLSIIMRALTSQDPQEILACLRTLLRTHAGTGFMHESFDASDPAHYTRAWFAWCNSLFGEMIATLAETRPDVLAAAQGEADGLLSRPARGFASGSSIWKPSSQ
jgi:meiotically up-regulated gene 157 (Mug157) protein